MGRLSRTKRVLYRPSILSLKSYMNRGSCGDTWRLHVAPWSMLVKQREAEVSMERAAMCSERS